MKSDCTLLKHNSNVVLEVGSHNDECNCIIALGKETFLVLSISLVSIFHKLKKNIYKKRVLLKNCLEKNLYKQVIQGH